MTSNKRRPRIILCVENSPGRVRDFEAWLPDGVDRLHVVTNGNTAMGVISRMQQNAYAGVMLYFDLNRPSLGAGRGYARS